MNNLCLFVSLSVCPPIIFKKWSIKLTLCMKWILSYLKQFFFLFFDIIFHFSTFNSLNNRSTILSNSNLLVLYQRNVINVNNFSNAISLCRCFLLKGLEFLNKVCLKKISKYCSLIYLMKTYCSKLFVFK